MPGPGLRAPRGLVPMLLVGVVSALVVAGLAQGWWPSNLHNGLLGVSFTFVGAYIAHQRPGHREGLLFLATGLVEATMFLGRQVAHRTDDAAPWWGWVGVWPVALGLGLTTLSVICFPDGRLPSPRWRGPAAAVVAVCAAGALTSALWPVEYAATGVTAPHPLDLPGAAAAETWWSALAHPAYAVCQVLWLVAVVARWRASGGHVRRQLAVLAGPVAASALALAIGLAGWGTPVPGLLVASLVPVAAGWAVVHGQQVAAYSALSWLSRTGLDDPDLPTAMARVASDAVGADGAVLWAGPPARLRAVGVWPDVERDVAPVALADLPAGHAARAVRRGREPVGALSVAPRERLSLAQERLLDDLAAQAALVLERVGLAAPASGGAPADAGLTPREQEVLELMARGLSNTAIAAELHLSIKTVEPAVSAVFAKLGLHVDAASNRRVLAVLAYLRR